jgi:hypothetical protein
VLDTAPAPTTPSTSLDLTHVYCCNPDLALCGEDVSNTPEVDQDEQLCMVCEDLEEQPCTCSTATAEGTTTP